MCSPLRILTSSLVSRKSSSGGVMRPRFIGSGKNSKTSSRGRATIVLAWMERTVVIGWFLALMRIPPRFGVAPRRHLNRLALAGRRPVCDRGHQGERGHADERVHDRREGVDLAELRAGDGGHQVEVEEAHEQPIEAADDDQHEGKGLENLHDVVLLGVYGLY